jgi:DNA-binding NarL/FixJ family response regulator
MTNSEKSKKITVGIVDDERLFAKSLGVLINSFGSFDVVIEALDGKEVLKKLEVVSVVPEIILLDVRMRGMNGPEAASAISSLYPQIKLVALTQKDDDFTIISMFKGGCCAYLLKDIHPDELERALKEVKVKGFYNADVININFRRLFTQEKKQNEFKISDRELSFLKLACSDLTYKQIASQMNLAERTIDGYRESLFHKLNVQSRVGLVLEAMKRELVKLQ